MRGLSKQPSARCSLRLAAWCSWGRGGGTCRPRERLESSYRDRKADKQDGLLSSIFLHQDHRHSGDKQPLLPFPAPPITLCDGVYCLPAPAQVRGAELLLLTGWRLALCPGRATCGVQLAPTASPLQLQKEAPLRIPILETRRWQPGEEAALAPDHTRGSRRSLRRLRTPECRLLSRAPKQAKERVRKEGGRPEFKSLCSSYSRGRGHPTLQAPFPFSPRAEKPLDS